MNNDRELLELAAKAAGIKGEWCDCDDCGDGGILTPNDNGTLWNPLTDFVDRYLLAKQLGLAIDFSECTVWKRLSDHSLIQEYWGGDYGDEAHAVLRAAAEIGRAMP